MRRRLTITQFTLIIVTVVTLSFVSLGYFIDYRFHEFTDDVTEKQAQQALTHLQQNLTQLQRRIENTGKSIARWQETHQQLNNSRFYQYWRDKRLTVQDYYFDNITGVELYDKDGIALVPDDLLNGFPLDISHYKAPYLLVSEFDYHHVAHITPIENALKEHVGYVLLVANLEKSLADYYPLSSIDMDSMRFFVQKRDYYRLAPLAEVADFDLNANKDVQALHQLVENNLTVTGALILGLTFLFMLFSSFILISPIRRLYRHIARLQRYHSRPDKIQPCDFYVEELQSVCNAVDEYHNQLMRMNADLDEKNQELWSQAHHDPLTGAFNRRAFEADWTHIQTATQGRRINVSFMLFDCDRFKALNDTYGHHIGDQVLMHIANDVQDCLRTGDKLYRLGGDEFATLLLDASGEDTVNIANRCLTRVKEHNLDEIGTNEPLQLSIGISTTLGENIERLRELHRQADVAMYHAKRPGNDKIAVYDDAMLSDSLVLLNNRVTTAVHNAVTGGESLELHYQVITDANTGKPVLHEALARIRDNDLLMMPDKILPVVHDRRIEIEFDLAVIRRLNYQLRMGAIPPSEGVAINVSGLSLLSDSVMTCLQKLKRECPNPIYIEVTETALITRLRQASEALEKLRKQGFKVFLDDFGSGYSSIRYLTHMPIDGIKFDISLVQALSKDDQDAMIVASLAQMIIKAGYSLVAEGIESEELLETVREVGFTHAQGYHLGRPRYMV